MGSTYELGITAGFDDHFATVWIDLNDNFGFEADEKFIDAMSLPANNVESTTDWTIPAGLAIGEHRMRVRITWEDDSPLDPCSDEPWGETEDYTVIIDEGTSIAEETPFDLGITQSSDFNSAFISLNKEAGLFEVMIMDAAGRKVRWKQFQKDAGEHTEEINTQYLVAGAYVVVVFGQNYRVSEKIIIQR
jgi:hypothetical protein